MKICKKCNHKNKDDSLFCIECGIKLIIGYYYTPKEIVEFEKQNKSKKKQKILKRKQNDKFIVASYIKRTIAFVIDIFAIFIITSLMYLIAYYINTTEHIDSTIYIILTKYFENIHLIGLDVIVLFIYMTIIEFIFSTTIGKAFLGIKIIDSESGNPPEFINIIFNSFGKAFLLPIDLLIGYLFESKVEEEAKIDLKQRIFQRMVGIVVIEDPTKAIKRKKIADRFQN